MERNYEVPRAFRGEKFMQNSYVLLTTVSEHKLPQLLVLLRVSSHALLQFRYLLLELCDLLLFRFLFLLRLLFFRLQLFQLSAQLFVLRL